MTEPDPFATSASRPSVSFDNATPGTTYAGTIAELPSVHPQTDYVTKKPKTYDDGNPMLCVCVPVVINGEEKAFWANKEGRDGGGMFSAIAKAQDVSGSRLAVGGKLTVTFTGMGLSKLTNTNTKKLFTATYEPPNVFATEAPAAVPAPPVAAPPPPPPAPVAAPAVNPEYAAHIAAGWTPEQIAASRPDLVPAAPVAAPPPPPPAVPAPPIADAQAAAVASLTAEQRLALGL